MQTKSIDTYFYFGLLLLTLFLAFLIFRPFLTTLVIGISFAVMLIPVHTWLTKKLWGKRTIASIVSVILFVIVLCVPLFFMGTIIFNQLQNLYGTITHQGSLTGTFDKATTLLHERVPAEIQTEIQSKLSDIVSFLSRNITAVFKATLTTILSFFLVILIMFYILKDSDKWHERILKWSPLDTKDTEKILHRLNGAMSGVIKGYLFIAFLQGALAGLGYWLFGVPNPAVWALLAGVAALIPSIGTGLTNLPIMIFLAVTGHIPQAVGLLIWAIAIVGTVDNILNPIIVGRKLHLPAIVILFSILGGLALLGPAGILIGPLTMSFLYALMSIKSGTNIPEGAENHHPNTLETPAI